MVKHVVSKGNSEKYQKQKCDVCPKNTVKEVQFVIPLAGYFFPHYYGYVYFHSNEKKSKYTQHMWAALKMDYSMLLTAWGKQFNCMDLGNRML